MSKYADMKNPPTCSRPSSPFSSIDQSIMDEMWQELQEQKNVIEEFKRMISEFLSATIKNIPSAKQ